ncbi:MAG: deoxyribodipyrimidine photo-lyase [Burkholderiales bacterium]
MSSAHARTLAAHPSRTEPVLFDRALVWFRRDLRSDDHAALSAALAQARQVWCVFVFDTVLLEPLPRADRRVEFIRESLVELDAALRAGGGELIVRHGPAVDEVPRLALQLGAQAVYTHRDYEPAAVARDARVRGALADQGMVFYALKDQVVFDTDELMTASGSPYSVFTPYKNAWLKKVSGHDLQPYATLDPAIALAGVLAKPPQPMAGHGVPSLSALGFETTGITRWLPPGMTGAAERLDDFLERIDTYAQARDFPAVKGPSYLSVDLRFGTVSPRRLARLAHERFIGGSRGAETWLSELIWREFYMQVLHHHPRVVDHCFRPEYDALRWEHGRRAEQLFAAWCEGRTGYPLVDAAMAQINQTGYMHNRLRMLTASFLTKDLGIDWRWGERYFAQHLNDYDLAANNGGWQWAASTGCDAQPYFRIFNPVTQSEKFDADGRFIRRYLPQLQTLPAPTLHAPWRAGPLELSAAGVVLGRDYPEPIVEHDVARQHTLARYQAVKTAARSGGGR